MAFSDIHLHHVVSDYGGLGGPVRIMLDDTGAEYEFHHHDSKEDFPKVKAQMIESGYPFDLAPMIEVDGQRCSGTLPIMRFVSKRTGKYIPASPELEQYVDITADYAMDWIRATLRGVFNIFNCTVQEYQKNEMDKYFKRFDRIYGIHRGPYAAGQEISYCDFLVYRVMTFEPNKQAIKDSPNLAALAQAIEARVNLKEALKQL